MKKKNFDINTMKKTLLVALFFVLVSSLQAQYDTRAKKILDDMSTKYQSYSAYSADFSYSMVNKVENISDKFNGKITIKGEKYRLDMGIQEIYNNGVTIWTYMPDEEEVNITEVDGEDDELTPSKIFTAYKSGYKYMLLDNEGGADFNVIDLIPEDADEQFFKVRMKISKSKNLIKSWEIFDKNGNNYTYAILSFNPDNSISDSYFEFDASKHPGVEVVDLR